MHHPLAQLIVRWSILALGVTIATRVVPGIRCDDASTLLVVVVLLSLFNAVLKPLLVLFTLPFILITLGLGMLLINAFLFLLVSRLVEGFQVESFWSALGGSLIVSVTNLLLAGLFRRGPPRGPGSGRAAPRREAVRGGDVIDI